MRLALLTPHVHIGKSLLELSLQRIGLEAASPVIADCLLNLSEHFFLITFGDEQFIVLK